MNTEDRLAWVEMGVAKEQAFLDYYGTDLSIFRNPGRARSKYEPDIAVLADLKSVTTPFFTSGRYGMNPQFTVPLNGRDVVKYNHNYPGIIIYFHVMWETLRRGNIYVEPMEGVWRTSLYHINGLIEAGAPLHVYKNRVNDTNLNAKDAYLFDIRQFERCA